MQGLFLALAGIVAIIYLVIPLVILSKLTLKSRARLEPLEIDEMLPEVYQHFGEVAPGLEACGFQLVAYVWLPDQMPNVQGYVALWLNRTAGQTATAAVLYASAGGAVTVKRYTEYLTKAADGMAVLTNNSKDLGSFKQVPAKDTLYAEGVEDLGQLYRLHLVRESRLLPPGSPRYLPGEGNELRDFADGLEYDIRRQAKTGYLIEKRPGLYRPTIRGAYIMTWGELPPVKQVRRALMRSRVRQELRNAEAGPVSPPVKVSITHVSPYCSPP